MELVIFAELIKGATIVLFDKVSVVDLPTSVFVTVGSVKVAEPLTIVENSGDVITAPVITGAVKVLFVSVSVEILLTRVLVAVGSVRVPVFTMVEKTGETKIGDTIVGAAFITNVSPDPV